MLSVHPDILAFGEVWTDSVVTQSFWILNHASFAVSIDSVYSLNEGFQFCQVGIADIAPGDSVEIDVSFLPADTLLYEGMATIEYQSLASVQLTGFGIWTELAIDHDAIQLIDINDGQTTFPGHQGE